MHDRLATRESVYDIAVSGLTNSYRKDVNLPRPKVTSLGSGFKYSPSLDRNLSGWKVRGSE